jgi:hypothetical protein
VPLKYDFKSLDEKLDRIESDLSNLRKCLANSSDWHPRLVFEIQGVVERIRATTTVWDQKKISRRLRRMLRRLRWEERWMQLRTWLRIWIATSMTWLKVSGRQFKLSGIWLKNRFNGNSHD